MFYEGITTTKHLTISPDTRSTGNPKFYHLYYLENNNKRKVFFYERGFSYFSIKWNGSEIHTLIA